MTCSLSVSESTFLPYKLHFLLILYWTTASYYSSNDSWYSSILFVFFFPDKTVFPLIACVGKKKQYTVSNLKQGQTYFFDLFATNRQSNLTYFFGSTSTKFDSRIKPISLRDGKSTFANLRKFDGKVIFKFKVRYYQNRGCFNKTQCFKVQ